MKHVLIFPLGNASENGYNAPKARYECAPHYCKTLKTILFCVFHCGETKRPLLWALQTEGESIRRAFVWSKNTRSNQETTFPFCSKVRLRNSGNSWQIPYNIRNQVDKPSEMLLKGLYSLSARSEKVKKWFECVWVSERVLGLCDCECDVYRFEI